MNKIIRGIFSIAGIILLSSILLVSGAHSQTNITECGQDINAPGNYVLTNDLIGGPTCINITANNVVFDGAGYLIHTNLPPNGTHGIVVTNAGDVTIENTVLSNWEYGIECNWSNPGQIINNKLSANTIAIYLDNSVPVSYTHLRAHE